MWFGVDRGLFRVVCAPEKVERDIVRELAGDASIPWESVGGYNVGGLGQKATGPPSKLPLVVRDFLGSGAVFLPFRGRVLRGIPLEVAGWTNVGNTWKTSGRIQR